MEAKQRADLDKQLSLGLVYGVWRFTDLKVKNPCPHASLDGKPFRLADGMKFQGSYIYPGPPPKMCRCVYTSVIPIFETDETLLQKLALKIRILLLQMGCK